MTTDLVEGEVVARRERKLGLGRARGADQPGRAVRHVRMDAVRDAQGRSVQVGHRLGVRLLERGQLGLERLPSELQGGQLCIVSPDQRGETERRRARRAR